MFKKMIKNCFKNWRTRTPLEASQPYIPAPPDQQNSPPVPSSPDNQVLPSNQDLLYQEIVSDEHRIEGTSISFGENSSVTVDNQQNAAEFHRKSSYILGSGRLVSHMEPTFIGDKLMPGVGGMCYFCRLEALAAYEEGLISVQEAERRSLFDSESAGQCDQCGRRDLCSRHSRPYPGPDGKPFHLCPVCVEAAQRGQWMQKPLQLLLLPFIKEEVPPQEKKEE